MNVVIRVDASIQIGSGHVIRCLSIAEALRIQGCKAVFFSQRLPGHLIDEVVGRGFQVEELPTLSSAEVRDRGVPHAESLEVDWSDDIVHTVSLLTSRRPQPDWLIVDHYALDSRWESLARAQVGRIMVIDDLANRPHECDLLLDQVCVGDAFRYRSLVPSTCRQLIGADYILLRPEFGAARSRPSFGDGWSEDGQIHLFFGSGDGAGHALRFSRLLLGNFPNSRLKLVAGVSSVHREALQVLAAESAGRLGFELGAKDMAAHMSDCALAIGTPGMSTWERACMGLPTLYLTNAENQTAILRELTALRFCEWLGHADKISDDAFILGVRKFLGDPLSLSRMRAKGLQMIDGRGLHSVIQAMI
jgi:UDP-2,4-diacetamido-2,4,6-trideoxy-beta-L-altropyranose hydrolase